MGEHLGGTHDNSKNNATGATEKIGVGLVNFNNHVMMHVKNDSRYKQVGGTKPTIEMGTENINELRSSTAMISNSCGTKRASTYSAFKQGTQYMKIVKASEY